MLNELKAINRDVDTRSYFVKEKSFGQLQPMEVLRHNICHLVNLLAKLASAADGPRFGNLVADRFCPDAIVTEVIPDLIIYALQFGEVLDVDIDGMMARLLSGSTAAGSQEGPLNRAIQAQAAADCEQGVQIYDLAMSLEETLRLACYQLLLATHEVARVCDSDDHYVDMPLDTVSSVVIERFIWAFRLAQRYRVDLDESYRDRLVVMEKKYRVAK